MYFTTKKKKKPTSQDTLPPQGQRARGNYTQKLYKLPTAQQMVRLFLIFVFRNSREKKVGVEDLREK